MVTRKRLRSILTALGLYVVAALLIGYFGVNAYDGNHGLRAKLDIDQQIGALTAELTGLQSERQAWERRIELLKPLSIDRDMLDEQTRERLDYTARGLEPANDLPKIRFCDNDLAGGPVSRPAPADFRHRAISAMG
jgi:cell division protein FtsB